MPLTEFQKTVLHVLAAQRKPESHVGGGTVINRSDGSPRYSADVDLFHDIAESVHTSAEADFRALANHGFTVEWLLRQPSLYRAQVGREKEFLRLDWCFDSAFRFFPVQPDPVFGYCLHPADLAANKALALAGRSEIRDFLDILYLHDNYLSLGAICWSACAKDQGFTPWSVLDSAKRNVKFRQQDLESEHLREVMSLTILKENWLKAVAEAEAWFGKLPMIDAGCLYLRPDGSPFTPDPADSTFSNVMRHFGSVRGAWPKLS